MKARASLLLAAALLALSGCVTNRELVDVRVELTGSITSVDEVHVYVTSQGEIIFGQGEESVAVPWSYPTSSWVGNFITVTVYPHEGDLMDGDAVRIEIYVNEELQASKLATNTSTVQIYRHHIQ